MKFTSFDALSRVPLFRDIEPAMREALAGQLERVQLRRGEVLFREGESSSGLYVVDSGEVRVLGQQATTELARLGPGEHVGEMSLVDPAPRSATIIARCDTTLWRLSPEHFDSLARLQPQLHRQLAIALARRLRDTIARTPVPHIERVVLVIDVRHRRDSEDGFPRPLADALAAAGRGSAAIVRIAEGTRPQIPDSSGDTILGSEPSELADRLDRLLETNAHVLIVSGADVDPGHVRAACDRADLVIVLHTIEPASLHAARRVLERLWGLEMAERPPVELAIDRRGERVRAEFAPVDRLAAGRVVHVVARTPGYVREGSPDFAGWGRLARRIARCRVGLALGGGGARAFAHIGVLSVFERAGVPIDVLAGTSGGAIVAGLIARDWDSAQIAEFLLKRWTRRGVVDWEWIPWVSLLRGIKLDRIGRDAGSGLTLEELTRPFVAVAADLVTGEEVQLRRGDGWTAVRASLAVPGVFPPVRCGDRYLVDGGAVNNLPAAAAREAGADMVIGIDVTPPLEPAFLAGGVTRDQSFWEKLRGWRLTGGLPLFRIIYRTITIQGQALRSRQAVPDFVLAPDIAGFDMFEFDDLHAIMDRGRSAAEARIDDVLQFVRTPPRTTPPL